MISITLLIIIVTAALSIMSFERPDRMDKMIFNAYIINRHKEWYRFISHGFIHADYPHLIVNMLTLYFFGELVENTFVALFGVIGKLLYIFLYLSGIAVASLYSFNKHKNHSWYNSLGASGAVSAVLYAAILIDPMMGIYMFFIPIPIPGIIYGVLYLVYSSYMSKRAQDNIGHDAHFYGAVYGFLLPILFKPALLGHFIMEIRYAIGL